MGICRSAIACRSGAVLLLALSVVAAHAAQPLSRDRVFEALEYRALTPAELATRIESRGVDFHLSDADWQLLLRKGGSPRLVQVIRANVRTSPPQAAAADGDLLNGPPLMRREVVLLLQSGMSPAKIVSAVANRGVDFPLTREANIEIWAAGGNLALMGEILLSSKAAEKHAAIGELFPVPERGSEPAAATAPPLAPAVPTAPEPLITSPKANPRIVPPPPSLVVTEPAPARAGRVTVDGALQATKLTERTLPAYPTAAAGRRLSGSVRLTVYINPEGAVEGTNPISGDPLLIGAATSAVRKWQYRPTIIDGVAVPVQTTVEVVFRPGTD